MRYELAVFDLDGTLLDTLDDLAGSVNYAMARYGYPLRSPETVRRCTGNGMRSLIEGCAPAGLSAGQIDEVLSTFRAHYAVHKTDRTAPYSGIPQALTQLRQQGVRMAVVSNKADEAVQGLVKQYFPPVFDAVVGERKGIRRKPAPDSVDEVLGQLHVPRTKAVYIGDSEYDVLTAVNAQMDLIAVSWGFRGKDLLVQSGARVIAQEPAQLVQLICAAP